MTTYTGFRAVWSDCTSSHGYRWPTAGEAVAPGPINTDNTTPCPHSVGDGICIAKTFSGAASGGIPAITMLVVEYADDDVLGEDDDKVRVSRATVTAALDFPELLRAGLVSDAVLANLSNANLSYADLSNANLSNTNLRYADLSDADLSDANLSGADLRYANLSNASLRYANLSDANLSNTNLRYADLSDADLRYASLRYANLSDADLSNADLRYANLSNANLSNTLLATIESGE